MFKPILFLDVDGVLNCHAWPNADYENLLQDIGGFRCLVPPETRERLRRILEHYEPVWATAWLGRAHSAWREALDLPQEPWPYVSYVEYKLPSIIKMAGWRPWAWVDDDANWEIERLGWKASYVSGLVISPDGRYGITEEIVEQLIEYAKEVGNRKESVMLKRASEYISVHSDERNTRSAHHQPARSQGARSP